MPPQYLFLCGGHHGKLVNFRPTKVESRFVNTTLTAQTRREFKVETRRWREVRRALRHVQEHGRLRSGIIEVMTDLKAKDLEQRTRELSTECLVSLGAVTKDMDVFTVSREDIEQLVGE
jgi:hypothetical protein